jgi:hypothetical protein
MPKAPDGNYAAVTQKDSSSSSPKRNDKPGSGKTDQQGAPLLSARSASASSSVRVMNRGKLKDKSAPKKKDDMKTLKFKMDTLDATILAAARLSTICDGELSIADVVGYLTCILVHFMAVCLQMVATILTFAFTVEHLEDPYETQTVDLVTEVLQMGTDMRSPLKHVVPSNGYPLTSGEAKQILRMCGKALEDLEYVHCVFLVLFLGIVMDETLKVLFRMNVVLCLPSRSDLEDSSDSEGDGENEEDYPRTSLQNKHQENHFITEMGPCWKVFMFIIFSFNLFFLCLVFWTFAKWIVLLHNIVKVAKMCLKLGFLLKFVKMMFDGYAPAAVKRVMRDGGFKIPKPGKGTFAYMWGTWLSTVSKTVVALIVTVLIVYVFFKNVFVVEQLCAEYAEAVPSYIELQGKRMHERVNSVSDLF